ncbi:hypothetical protein BATDEDRAFT_22418 [Batrachochytrium dendrobatidis JAM81]|uniref:Uncharacterized protein n=1 Tax=Batrachochytrium dendrobatidis (strain JAM81 / FGSC 10211) TaxID=684364 RepID=F4NU97_BATDJ|nr:uncharacterized protein BATDEDRAFT_22418 [Batrachochytrium dendrobatidis JAM81]EGF83595.1 hypothetical protein BATDEDRAFT_22418 [Batrachochytrium dendrobatidis JAM81]|eukprot:XP_006675564.1 hypothetical protein BATDEDRAFT_22418 [Batrachochytrium dendrobatidis JAM81]
MTMGNIRGHLAFISNHHIKHISKIDCWTTQLGARVRITVPESCSAHTIHQLCHQSSIQQLTHTKTVNAGIQRHPHCVFHHFLIVVKYCQSMCQTLPANTHYFDIYSAKPTMWIIRDLHCNGQFQAHIHSTHPTDISQLCIYAYDRIAMFTIGGIYAAFDGSYTDTHELCIQLLDAANATVNDCQLHAHAHTAREHKRRLYRSIKRTT